MIGDYLYLFKKVNSKMSVEENRSSSACLDDSSKTGNFIALGTSKSRAENKQVDFSSLIISVHSLDNSPPSPPYTFWQNARD